MSFAPSNKRPTSVPYSPTSYPTNLPMDKPTVKQVATKAVSELVKSTLEVYTITKSKIEAALIGLVTTHYHPTVHQTEIDFGSLPVGEMSFIVYDSNITSTNNISVQLAYVAPTNKGFDELEFDSFEFRCSSAAGMFTLYARSLEGYVADRFKINYIY
jgi:hypothetical protein